MVEEHWRPIEGWSELYEVSDSGRVRSLDRLLEYRNRWGGRTQRIQRGRVLRTRVNGRTGYQEVALWSGSRASYRLVHRLVARAFLGTPPSRDREVNHKNGDKTDNRLGNLEWVTRSENHRHAAANGLRPRGTSVNTNRLTMAEVRDIRRKLGTIPQRAIAREYGVTQSCVMGIATGRNWAWLK